MGNTGQLGAGGTTTNVESMNFTVVEQKLSPYVESYNTYYENIQDIDTKVAENVQQSGGAIGGTVGQALFSEWSENCVPLLNFKRYFEDIKTRISTIYNSNAEAYNASMDQYATDQNGNPTEGIVTENSDVYSVYGDETYTGGESAAGVVTEATTEETSGNTSNETPTEEVTEAATEAVTETATEATTEAATEVATEAATEATTEATEIESAMDNAGNETTVM